MSDHNSWTPRTICLKFWLWNLEGPQEFSLDGFGLWDSKLNKSTLKGKEAKIVIYDQVRVNSGSNYE